MIKRKMSEYVMDYVFNHTRLVGITDKRWNSFYAFFYLDVDDDNFLTEEEQQKIVDAVNEKSDYHEFKEIYVMKPRTYNPDGDFIYENMSIDEMIDKLVESANQRLYNDKKKCHDRVLEDIATHLKEYTKFKDDPFGHILHHELVDILKEYFGDHFLTNFDKIEYDKIKSDITEKVNDCVTKMLKRRENSKRAEMRENAWSKYVEDKLWENGLKHKGVDYYMTDEYCEMLKGWREEFDRTYKD